MTIHYKPLEKKDLDEMEARKNSNANKSVAPSKIDQISADPEPHSQISFLQIHAANAPKDIDKKILLTSEDEEVVSDSSKENSDGWKADSSPQFSRASMISEHRLKMTNSKGSDDLNPNTLSINVHTPKGVLVTSVNPSSKVITLLDFLRTQPLGNTMNFALKLGKYFRIKEVICFR